MSGAHVEAVIKSAVPIPDLGSIDQALRAGEGEGALKPLSRGSAPPIWAAIFRGAASRSAGA